MTPVRALPDFWYPIARILLALKALLSATAPDLFATISARVHLELRLSGALVRRYLFALAHEMQLPPCTPSPPAAPSSGSDHAAPRRAASGFRIAEPERAASGGGNSEPSSDLYIEWALALQRVDTLLAAMRAPDPIARRIARQLARNITPHLRDLAVPAFVLRRIPPELDVFLMRLDARARPEAWAGMDPDSG